MRGMTPHSRLFCLAHQLRAYGFGSWPLELPGYAFMQIVNTYAIQAQNEPNY